jgi:hypothetical protein
MQSLNVTFPVRDFEHPFRKRTDPPRLTGPLLAHETMETYQFCDLCGALLPAGRLHTIPGNAQLCEHCYRQFQALPEGTVHQCIERYLMGNVV